MKAGIITCWEKLDSVRAVIPDHLPARLHVRSPGVLWWGGLASVVLEAAQVIAVCNKLGNPGWKGLKGPVFLQGVSLVASVGGCAGFL